MLDEADRELAARAAGQHGVFTLARRARAAGSRRAQIASPQRRALWVHDPRRRLSHAGRACRRGDGDLLAACLAADAQPAAVSHRSAAALYELPGARDDLVEITCRRWKRTQKPGTRRAREHAVRRCRHHDRRRHPGRRRPSASFSSSPACGRIADYVERVIQAARRKRLITYDVDARDVRPSRADAASRACRPCARRSSAGIRDSRPTRQRHGDAAAADPARPRAARARDAVRRARSSTATSSRRPISRFRSGRSRSSTSRSRSTRTSSRSRGTIVGATRSSPRATRPLTARYDDVRNGGRVLVERDPRDRPTQAS